MIICVHNEINTKTAQTLLYLLFRITQKQPGPGAHPASYEMGNVSFAGVQRPGRVPLTTQTHLVPKLKKEYSCTSTPPLCLHGRLQGELHNSKLCANNTGNVHETNSEYASWRKIISDILKRFLLENTLFCILSLVWKWSQLSLPNEQKVANIS